MLQMYNYKVIDDSCEKETSSRLNSVGNSYRNKWAPQKSNKSSKTNIDLIHSLSEDSSESPSILEDVNRKETDNDALTERKKTPIFQRSLDHHQYLLVHPHRRIQ